MISLGPALLKPLWLFPGEGLKCKILSALIISIIPTYIYADNKAMEIKLSPAQLKDKNLALLLEKRSSCRNFQQKILRLEDLASLLWAGCGKKHDSLTHATRTIPSAGAIYPLEIYVAVGPGCVDKLKEGVYRYLIEDHSLKLIIEGDKRGELTRACLNQGFIYEAPISVIITAKFSRTTDHYGLRGERYVYMEAGHASQNIYLAATNLGFATCEVGAFEEDRINNLLNLDKGCNSLIVMPIGYPK